MFLPSNLMLDTLLFQVENVGFSEKRKKMSIFFDERCFVPFFNEIKSYSSV